MKNYLLRKTAVILGLFCLLAAGLGCAAKQKPPDVLPDGTAVYAADVTMADRTKKKNFSVDRETAEMPELTPGEDTGQSRYFPKAVTGAVEPLAEEQAPVSVAPAPPPGDRQDPRKALWRPPPLPRETVPDKPQAGQIVFNFDDADIYEVIRTMGELLNINYIVDPNVRGKVTIHTARGLRKEELFPVFYQLLEANGLTAVREGEFYKILPMKDAPRQPIYPSFGRDVRDMVPGQRMVIQIIPLDYILAAEMTKLLTPFVSAEGTIISDTDSNTLLVVDRERNLDKLLRLVAGFDVNVFERYHHRFFPLEYTEAEDIAATFGDISGAYGATIKDKITVLAIKRLNTLLVITTNPQVFEKIQTFIDQLDVPRIDAEHRIYVYSVKNGKSEDLADILGKVFANTDSEDKDRKKATDGETPNNESEPEPAKSIYASKNPFAVPQKSKPESAKPKVTVPGQTGGQGTLKEDIRVTADPTRNVLLIEAIPSDYQIVRNILQRLDVLPRQVLIEATIAEISLDATTRLGVDWSYTKDVFPGSGLLSGTITGETGLVALVGIGNRVLAQLEVLATENKVNILSSPHVLASDNQEARIDVSQEIPIASSETVVTSGTTPLVTTNIQYRDAGVILTVTPHINEHGLVTLDISQEVSEPAGNKEVGGQSYPSFFKRVIDTTLTVQHGQTIVLGGLIRETKSETKSGVPWFFKIPFIGWMFGLDVDEVFKTELIVLLTPMVVISPDDIDLITEDFESKVGNVMRDFKERLRTKTRQTRPVKDLVDDVEKKGS